MLLSPVNLCPIYRHNLNCTTQFRHFATETSLISIIIFKYGVHSVRVFIYTFFLLEFCELLTAVILGINASSFIDRALYQVTGNAVYFLAV